MVSTLGDPGYGNRSCVMKLNCYSILGTGFMIHGIRPRGSRKFTFTTWICLLYLPIIPFRRWEAEYSGSFQSDASVDPAYEFDRMQQIPHDWLQNSITLLSGWSLAGLFVFPLTIMIHLTNGRAATTIECVLMILLAVLLGLLPMFVDWRRHRSLTLGANATATQ